MTTKRVPSSSGVRNISVAYLFTPLVMGTGSAYAQAGNDLALEEVIVTAQKREQSLEEVPSAVSAISGDTVHEYLGSAENIRALAGRVPGLQVESSNGRTQPRFYLRGMGNIDFDNNASQPVSMVFDEIALENNVLRSLPLFDIERVEVLKGPQGSLFGRNTNAGIIKIDSVRPSDEQQGYVSAAYGSRDTIAVEGAGGGQLGDKLSARVSLKYQERGDWIDNVANGPGDDFGAFDEFAYRLQLLYDADSFRGLLKLHGFQQDGTQPQVFYANAIALGSEGLRAGFDEEIANHDGGASMELDHYGAALNLQWDFGTSTFTSITGYDTVENFQSTDVDGGLLSFDPADIGTLGRQVFFSVATGDGLDDHYQFTQEFRISNQADKLFYQAGLYYFDEDIDIRSTTFHVVPNFSEIVSQQTTSAAVFGQVEYALTDALSIMGGVRYTSDDKDLEVIPGPGSPAPPGTIAVDDDYFNWDLAFTYDVGDDFSWFGRIATGSRGPVTLGRFGFTSSADTETSTRPNSASGSITRWSRAVSNRNRLKPAQRIASWSRPVARSEVSAPGVPDGQRGRRGQRQARRRAQWKHGCRSCPGGRGHRRRRRCSANSACRRRVADDRDRVGPGQGAVVHQDGLPGEPDGRLGGESLAVDRDRLGAGLPQPVDHDLQVLGEDLALVLVGVGARVAVGAGVVAAGRVVELDRMPCPVTGPAAGGEGEGGEPGLERGLVLAQRRGLEPCPPRPAPPAAGLLPVDLRRGGSRSG